MGIVEARLEKLLKESIRIGDPSIEQVTDEVVDSFVNREVTAEFLLEAVRVAQGGREWAAMIRMSEAVLCYQDYDEVDAELVRRYAQALIETGAFGAAKAVLDGMLERSPLGDQSDEAQGLLGRVAKQRFLDFHCDEQLYESIRAYTKASQMPGVDPVWVGVNLLALLRLLEKEGGSIEADAGIPTLDEVADRLERDLASGSTQDSIWYKAAAIELEIFRGRGDEAARLAESLPSDKSAFGIGSLRRQLRQVWGLDAQAPVMMALANFEIESGSGADIEVPGPGELEKILHARLPVPCSSLQHGLDLARSVCRITDYYRQPQGTGFLLAGSSLNAEWSDDLVLLTNNHVVPTRQRASGFMAEFTKLVRDVDGDLERVVIEKLEFFWTSTPDDLDATILLFDNSLLPQPVSLMKVASRQPTVAGTEDPHVFVVGHPLGRDLEMSIRGNELIGASDRRLHYKAATDRGSSGSPVLDPNWDLVGIHHSGHNRIARIDDPSLTYAANEAINIAAIRKALKSVQPPKPSQPVS